MMKYICFCCPLVFWAGSLVSGNDYVEQSARHVPVAHEVDLLVIGGSTGAVAAASEALDAGASVLLVTPYSYLGEDRTATLRLWGEKGENRSDPLFSALANDSVQEKLQSKKTVGVLERFSNVKNRLPFHYEITGKINPSHPETKNPPRLCDGEFLDSIHHSLQVDANPTIILDLGEIKKVEQLTLLTYRRADAEKTGGAFGVKEIEIAVASEKEKWAHPKLEFFEDGCQATEGGDEAVAFTAIFEPPVESQYVRLDVRRQENTERILLGELIVLPEKLTADSPSATKPEEENDAASSPRPLHVKRTLDRILLEKKIPFLLMSPVSDFIRDERENPCGALITNRSGRQAVLAKRILDTRPKNPSLECAEFVVIGGKPLSPDLGKYPYLKSCRHEIIGRPFVGRLPGKANEKPLYKEFPLINYTFELSVPENMSPSDPLFRAELEKQIRLAVYSKDQAFTADEVFLPHEFKPLDHWRSEGKRLAGEALSVKTDFKGSIHVTEEKDAGRKISGDIRENLEGIRTAALGYDGGRKTLVDPKRNIPVLAEYDVVVVGGGTSGAPAGIGAGREGVKTLVLEYLHDLGGIGTAGAITNYWFGNRVGFTKEVQDGLGGWQIEHRTQWWREKSAEAHADVWYGVLACGALVDGNRVNGVLVSTPYGTGVVTAKFVIDATGNADIAAVAGAETKDVDDKEIAVQGAGLAPRDLGWSYRNTDFMFVDDTDVVDASHVYVYAKEKYPTAFDQGKLISTRERRQVVGDFSFSVVDQLNHRTYPDTLYLGKSNYDSHGYTIDPFFWLYFPHEHRKEFSSYVPYRSCLPQGLDGIFVCGLATSCHRDALPIIRMQPDLQNQGYALGLAAATLCQEGIRETRKIDFKKFQQRLVDLEILNKTVLSHEDNYGKNKDRLPSAVENLPDQYDEIIPLVLWYPEDSKALVHDAYLKADNSEAKLIYAKVAATLGDPVGLPTLHETIRNMKDWDDGWNFRGMGQFGPSSSPLDHLILMLGHLGDKSSIPVIVEKATLLEPKSKFSHFRAVALALENLGGPEAARILSELLDKPGVTGHVHDSVETVWKLDQAEGGGLNQNNTRRNSLIEISLARALYRCGDQEGKGERILRSYTGDLRGHFARHAQKVLDVNGDRK